MTKPRRNGGIVSPPTQEGHLAAHDAPDNPPSIPQGSSPATEEDPEMNPPERVDLQRSSWLQLTESMMIGTGDKPVARVCHRFTTGTNFITHTHTCKHRTCDGYGYILYRNLHGVKQVGTYQNYERLYNKILIFLKNTKK